MPKGNNTAYPEVAQDKKFVPWWVQMFADGGPVKAPPPAPASTPQQVAVALQQAGQYAGLPNALTPQNAPDVGLDPARGYVAKTTPTDQPQQPQKVTPEEPKPPSMAPGLGTVGGAPVAAPAPPKPPADWPDKPVEAKAPADWPDKPIEAKVPQETKPPSDWPDKPVEEPQHPPAKMEPVTAESVGVTPEQPKAQPPPKTYPTITDEDIQGQISALIAQGKSPGEARAIVAGEQPKTISGAPPGPPKPKPAEPPASSAAQPHFSYEKYDIPVAQGGYLRPDGTTDLEKADADKAYDKANPPTATVAQGQAPAGRNVQEGTKLSGMSTIFGLNYDGSIDKGDNGRGFFGNVNTRDPNTKGVAVPIDVLEKTFGTFTKLNAQGGYDLLDTPEAHKIYDMIRSSHVELADKDGTIHKFPIVDIQGTLKFHPGHVLDLTYGAAKEMGFKDNSNVSYSLVGGDGKTFDLSNLAIAQGGGAGGGGKGRKGGGKGEDVLVPMVPSEGGAPSPAQAQTPVSQGTSGARAGIGQMPQPPQGSGSFGGLGTLAAGALLGGALRGRGQPQAPQPEEEEENPLVTALTKRGFTLAQAQQYAQSMQTVAPGKGVGPLQIEAPAAPTQALPAKPLALPAPAQPATQAPGLSLLQKQPEIAPRKIPQIVPAKQPTAKGPAAPAAAGVSQADKSAVVQSLVGMGLNKGHAQQLVAAAPGNTVNEVLQNALRVHGQGAIRGVESASFKPPTTAAAPPPPAPAAKAPPQKPPTLAAREPAEYGPPKGSTHGVAKPPSFSALTPGLKLPEAVKEHAALLSPDDPRVKKQADGKIKGEHFVEGDPVHDQLLEGLPGGKAGDQRRMAGEAEDAIRENRAMHISYLSAPKEAAKFPTRESRTVQYEEHSPEARLMGSTTGQLVGHSFIPVATGIKLPRKKGEPHQSYIDGISTNILANNFQHANEKLASLGIKAPYKSLGAKFSNDLEGYYSNLNAGHTGTGRGYAVGTEDHPNEPDTSHVPYKLSRQEADFINLVINNTAAFAGHEDAQKLRELAKANGTLITPAGETNRLRHNIEQTDPGWRERVLEPSIRTFNTGLIVAHHADERHFPETIRPGKEFQDLTRAIQRTSERGRPDVPIAVSLHHTFQDNRVINKIERDFSEDKIDEAEARKQLEALGEDPDEYRFVGGSGGLITPYEDDPEALTPEEHTQMKNNLREQWVGGKLDADKYRQKSAEVPLPSKPSKKPERLERINAAAARGVFGDIYEGGTHSKALREAREAGEKSNAIKFGFLTDTDRFVDAEEAHRIALKSKQISHEVAARFPTGAKPYLTSEDLDLESEEPKHFARGGLVKAQGDDPLAGQTVSTLRAPPAPAEQGDDQGAPGATAPVEAPVEPQEKPEPSEGIKTPVAKAKPPVEPPALGEAPKAAEPLPGSAPKFRPAKPEEFIAARDKSKRPQYLSPLDPDEIRSHKLFMTEDGKTGAAVSPEGDIQNVFNNGGPKGAGVHALVHAIDKHGGHTLDAFDPYLPELYSQFGFKETGRMKFNREYAPPKWDHVKDDSPDVVFMGHAGYPQGGAEAALARSHEQDEKKRIPYEPGQNYSDDWEAQKAASQLHARGAGDYPSAGEGQEEGAERAGGPPSPGAGEAYRPAVEPPALGEVPPAAKAKKAAAAKAKFEKPPNWDEQPEEVRQAYLEKKVARTLKNQHRGPETHKLKVDRDDDGGVKYDPQGNPVYEKRDYDIANAPLLGKKGLSKIADADQHPDEIDPEEHTHLNGVERSRLSALREQSAVETLGDKIVDSYMGIKDIPEIAAGHGWYSRMRKKLADALGEHHELFAQLLGATSAKTPVRNNFIQALDALEQFKNGDFDRHIEKYLEGLFHLKMGGREALVQHMKDTGVPLVDEKGNAVDTHDSDGTAMANWIAHHDILPKQKNGQKYNANSNAVLKALAGTWLHEVDAPKTPNFAGNLTGRTLAATIDVWAARHLQRLGYEGLTKGKPWRAQGAAESAVNALDFSFSQDAMKHAADKLSAMGHKMNPDDLQAILWFAEKHHYEDKGWTRGAGAEKSSFDDVADLAFPKTGEPMTSEDLRAHYAALREAAAKRKARIKTARTYVGHANPKMAAKLEPYMQQHGLTHEEVHGPAAEPDEEEAA